MRWTDTDLEKKQPSSTEEFSPESSSPQKTFEVLVLNRDPELRAFLGKALYAGNLSSTSVSTESEAFACLRKGSYGLALVGMDSPESMDFLSKVREEFLTLPLLALARTATPELVRQVLRAGATDFLFGSLDTRTFTKRVLVLLEGKEESASAQSLSRARAPKPPSGAVAGVQISPGGNGEEYPIICRNKKMKRILEIAETIATTDSTVLIQGESGTGKEVIAKRIHHLSKRQTKPFVEVNCGALPENLLESQLFGHEKGSFTGAVHRQVGLFEIADQGTIFLDEIGEMSLDMQVKLLRVLQFREFRRIGGSQVVKVDVRVIAATNKELKVEVEKKHFRPDLFYRLNVISLEIPPLRERLEEIPDLVTCFSERIAKDRSMPKKEFAPEAIVKLQKYRWTGNVRELENAVERLILLTKKEVVDALDLDEHLGESAALSMATPFAPTLTLDEVKRIHISNVLHENAGNKMKTARTLKINVKTLYNLMKKLEIK